MSIGQRLGLIGSCSALWRNRIAWTSMMSLQDAQAKPVENSMKSKIQSALQPTHLEIINESHMHNVPKGSETHFRVFIVSALFNNQTLIKRHQLVHKALEEELKGPVHALSIQAKTPEQYEDNLKSGDPGIAKSPPCRGGFGH